MILNKRIWTLIHHFNQKWSVFNQKWSDFYRNDHLIKIAIYLEFVLSSESDINWHPVSMTSDFKLTAIRFCSPNCQTLVHNQRSWVRTLAPKQDEWYVDFFTLHNYLATK